MVRHVISVCVFCFICATHSPCGSHASVAHEAPRLLQLAETDRIRDEISMREKFKEKPPTMDIRIRRDLGIAKISNSNNINKDNSDKDVLMKEIFRIYGDGETMSIEGFESLISQLLALKQLFRKDSDRHHNSGASDNKFLKNKCAVRDELKSLKNLTAQVTQTRFVEMCPSILSSLLVGDCNDTNTSEDSKDESDCDEGKAFHLVWIYSTIAVFVISFCGVLALVIVPVMKKKFYKPLLQFLVALAVGTLAGDALLHLLPHAMTGAHSGAHGHGEHGDNENMWKGFVAMLGLILFFIIEKFVPVIYKWGKGKRSTGHSRVKVLTNDTRIKIPADTQCMDKYNTHSRCYRDILEDPTTTYLSTELAANDKARKYDLHDESEVSRLNNSNNRSEPTEPDRNVDNAGNCCDADRRKSSEQAADYTVILNHHATSHHGHSHAHGHVHAPPRNISSVAWMVIMGDGLHNFTDGMAIGAAFSGGIAGGCSTAVAVFCHELPHELGDFAMLLKAGMTIKQALCYNILSSVLCILGNILGIYLGNIDSASSWVFAVAAGTFIYIALVDMIPELSSAHEDENNLVQSILHLSGLLLGFAIMTLIALYEHDLKNILQ